MTKQPSTNVQFSILLLAALVTVLNIAVTNVALPNIAADLDAGGIQIHLIADGFMIALASGVLIFGAIGDRFGRKLLFMSGSALMIITSLFSGFSTSANELIFWRMVAGLSAAMLYPTTLSMTTTIFTESKARLMAIGIWSGFSAAGAAIAPVLAGLLLEVFDWGSVFLISVPLTLIAFCAGWRWLPNHKLVSPPTIDWVGGALSIFFMVVTLFAIILVPDLGFSVLIMACLAASLVSLIAFIWWENRVKEPLLDLSVFKRRDFALASFTITLVAFAQLGVMYLAQQFVQNVLGYTTLQAGLSVLPLSVAILVASPMAAKMVAKVGARLVVTIGLLLVGAGFVMAQGWTVDTVYFDIAIPYILLGIGLGLTMTPMTNTIMNTLPQAKAGIGSAVNDVTRDFGQALGIAVNGSIAAIGYTKGLQTAAQSSGATEPVQVSQDILTMVTSSLSGALTIAQQYPGVQSDALVAAAKQAFLHGQLLAMMLSAVLCFIGAGLVFSFFPKKK